MNRGDFLNHGAKEISEKIASKLKNGDFTPGQKDTFVSVILILLASISIFIELSEDLKEDLESHKPWKIVKKIINLAEKDYLGFGG